MAIVQILIADHNSVRSSRSMVKINILSYHEIADGETLLWSLLLMERNGNQSR